MSFVRAPRALAFVFAIFLSNSLVAQVRPTVGPAKCVDCHDHRDEKEWWQTKDGDGKGKQHAKADRRLEDPKSAAYGKSIGVTDVYDVNGACVSCHATTVAGSADFGVSCESCHGPGRDYFTPHQTQGAYAAAVKLGMTDIKDKPAAWARTCLGCHVLEARPGMQPLIKAGHASGSDFDLARKFPAVALHFTAKYQPAQIAAAAASFRPASTPVEAVVRVAESAPPRAEVTTPAAGVNPSPAPPPARANTAENVPTPVRPSAAPRVDPVSLPPVTPPIVNAAVSPAAPPANGVTAAPVPAPPAPAPPATRASSLQDRLVVWLGQLVGSNTQLAIATPPAIKQVYRGPDAELLRLQDEVIRLAIEALATPPRRQ